MDTAYLAIENDLAIHERESQFWQSRGFGSVRVSSMSEGIELASKQQFLYIGINADNIYYKSSLPLLREITADPIFMATTNYTIQEQTAATKLGADLFGQLGEVPEDNYDAVMTQIQHLNSRVLTYKPNVNFIKYRNILMFETHRIALVDDKEVDLTKTEFDLLILLASNRGRVFTFENLYRYVWGGTDYDKAVIETIKNAVARLRNKIADNDERYSVIESLRGVGFKCPSL